MSLRTSRVPRPKAYRKRISALRSVLAALVVASVARLFLVDLVVVRGDSMTPTIARDSVAVLWRCAYGLRSPVTGRYLVRWAEPGPGDIVVIAPDRYGGGGAVPRLAVKRVFEVGPAYITQRGVYLYARGGTASTLSPVGPGGVVDPAPRFLPSGRAFLVGDNGPCSLDSRTYGAVPIETIQGKVILYRGGVSRRTLDAVDEGRDS